MDTQLTAIKNNLNLSPDDRNVYTKGALNDHSESCSKKVIEGPIDKMVKGVVHDIASTVKSVASKVSNFWKS